VNRAQRSPAARGKRATPETMFGTKRLAAFGEHVRNDPQAIAHLEAGGAIILDALDGRGGIEAAIHEDELAFRAFVYEEQAS
jgi:hypothetical protein